MTPRGGVHPAVQRDRGVRRPAAERGPLLPPVGSPPVLPVVRGRPVGAAHRQPVRGGSQRRTRPRSRVRRRNRRRPSPSTSAGASIIRPTSPRSRSTRSTTPIASCRRSTRISATAKTATWATWTIEGFDAQVGHRFGELLSLTLSASYNNSELEGSLDPALDGKKLVETPEWTYRARAWISTSPKTSHVGLQAKKVGRSLRHGHQRRNCAGIHRGRYRPELRLQALGHRRRRVAAERHQPARRRVFRQHQLGHGRHSVGFYSIGAPRTVVASLRFDF